MTAQTFDPRKSAIHQPIQFTSSAANKVKAIQREKAEADIKLRLYITGGGCSGFQYGFTFDEQINEDDTVIATDKAKLLVDPLSFSYLEGAQVDYVEGLEGAKFVVNNPNAKSTCSCGSSFTI